MCLSNQWLDHVLQPAKFSTRLPLNWCNRTPLFCWLFPAATYTDTHPRINNGPIESEAAYAGQLRIRVQYYYILLPCRFASIQPDTSATGASGNGKLKGECASDKPIIIALQRHSHNIRLVVERRRRWHRWQLYNSATFLPRQQLIIHQSSWSTFPIYFFVVGGGGGSVCRLLALVLKSGKWLPNEQRQ